MQKNQKGFSILEMLIVVVIIGLVAAVGWLVYDRQQNKSVTNQQTTPVNTVSKQETPKTETLPAGYVNYKNNDLGIAFNHPMSWGDVSISQKARNGEDFEPVKTYYISFSEQSKFSIKISPNTWKFTGGPSEWDFPETNDSFQNARNSKEALQISVTDNSYLQITWNGIDDVISMQAAKKLELTKIPAEYAEFQWASVDSSCAIEVTNGKKPQASCYGQALVDDTKKVLDSFTKI